MILVVTRPQEPGDGKHLTDGKKAYLHFHRIGRAIGSIALLLILISIMSYLVIKWL